MQVVRPESKCVFATTAVEAESILFGGTIEMFIASLDVTDRDVVDMLLLCQHLGRSARHTIVTGRAFSARLVVSLRALAVNGVLDLSDETPVRVEHALRLISGGRNYWSPTVSNLFGQGDCRIVLHQLSPSEQLGLAILGDGCGDELAAARLNMLRGTIRALRRDLYTKLGAHDRCELIRCAMRLGYTGVGPEGVSPFGLAMVVSEYLTRSKRPGVLPMDLLVRCRILPEAIGAGSFSTQSSICLSTLK